jgi:hypothetical protein
MSHTAGLKALGGEKNLLLLSVIERRPSCSLLTIPTELSRFLVSFKEEIFGFQLNLNIYIYI